MGNLELVDPKFFWRGRRARPLSEVVILPKGNLHQVIRGWLTARLLDLVEIEEANKSCVVVAPDGTRRTLLTSVPGFDGEGDIEEWEYLSAALEASLLALINLRHGRPEPWQALSLLHDFGSHESSQPASYRNLLVGGSLPGLKKFADAPDALAALGQVASFFGGTPSKAPSNEWKRAQLHLQIRSDITAAALQMQDMLRVSPVDPPVPPG